MEKTVLLWKFCSWGNYKTGPEKPRGGGGAGGVQPPQNFAKFYSYELKKIVLKWKIVQSTKTSWNSSKAIVIYKITIELNTRNGLFCR